MKYGITEFQYQQIIKVFANYREVESAILYGSRAKGCHKPYSDIDITLVGNSIDLSLLQKIEIELDDLILPYKFDISSYKSIENIDLLEHIERVDKEIYRREN